jgi:hypothetical protein
MTVRDEHGAVRVYLYQRLHNHTRRIRQVTHKGVVTGWMTISGVLIPIIKHSNLFSTALFLYINMRSDSRPHSQRPNSHLPPSWTLSLHSTPLLSPFSLALPPLGQLHTASVKRVWHPLKPTPTRSPDLLAHRLQYRRRCLLRCRGFYLWHGRGCSRRSGCHPSM